MLYSLQSYGATIFLASLSTIMEVKYCVSHFTVEETELSLGPNPGSLCFSRQLL